MEWKIGEIRQVNGEWYQCVEELSWGVHCNGCDFLGRICSKLNPKCSPAHHRSDGKSVIFKKLEKVGEPYTVYDGILLQSYRIFEELYINQEVDKNYIVQEDREKNLIAIEIKQNKEDMEENKFNLKPFDLQKAKEGKPVCTRDGRKARIICFDRIDSTGCNLTIVALIQVDETEVLQLYHDNGKCDAKADLDLMMLPEKKEGWAKIRKDINLYDTKEEADRKMIGNDEYVTAKVCWEEQYGMGSSR